MTHSLKNWLLLGALAGATLASTLPAQTTTTRTVRMVHTSGSNTTTLTQGGGAEDPQVKDDLFAGTEQFNKNATDVTEINMGPDSLGMVGGRHYGESKNMVLNIVRSYGYDKPGMYDLAAVEAFRNKLNTGEWRCTVHTRNNKTGESTDVCSRARNDGMREEAIITIEPKELTFIHTIRKANTGDGGHSEAFFGPLPGVGGIAMMAMNDPDNFVQMLLAQHGVILNSMQGLMDLKLDTIKIMADSQIAAIKPFTLEQLNGLSRNLNIHVNAQPNVRVFVKPDVPAPPAPAAAPAPAAPAAPAAAPAPAAPPAPEAKLPE